MMLKKIDPKSLQSIKNEWDALCVNRQETIEAGKDFSLLAVTAPYIIEEFRTHQYRRVIDIGCGTGYLTSLIAKHAQHVVGIDISPKSIELATTKYSAAELEFITASIAEYKTDQEFDVCVANMFFSCDPDWISSIRRIKELLVKDGHILVMIPHPYTWPKHWRFENEQWFNPCEETYIEHDFSISLAKSLGTSTYIHRPFLQYVKQFYAEGFILTKIDEPYPVRKTPDEYTYDFPRFLFMKYTKQ